MARKGCQETTVSIREPRLCGPEKESFSIWVLEPGNPGSGHVRDRAS